MVFVAFKEGFIEGYRHLNGRICVDITRDVRKAMPFENIKQADQLMRKVPHLGYYAALSAVFPPMVGGTSAQAS
jgi:hypothetical protein